MYPVLLKPVFKQIIWGGNRLKDDFGFDNNADNIAESWMLTCRDDGDNTVLNGEYAGKTLSQLVTSGKSGLLGTSFDGKDFPLLIKLIDAESDLSVQVHPDDEYAAKHENSRGKTEAWYILDADEDAKLIYGFNKEITKEQFRDAIENNTFLDYVNRVTVKKGDFFFIEAGTLHAIGGGILLAEVQQNCNTTYRVYDYNRLDNGKPRPLHTEKAIDVTVTKPPLIKQPAAANYVNANKVTNLCSCDFFTMKTVQISGWYDISVDGKSFVSIIVLEGNGEVSSDGKTERIKKGDSVFIAADSYNVNITGKLSVLISTL